MSKLLFLILNFLVVSQYRGDRKFLQSLNSFITGFNIRILRGGHLGSTLIVYLCLTTPVRGKAFRGELHNNSGPIGFRSRLPDPTRIILSLLIGVECISKANTATFPHEQNLRAPVYYCFGTSTSTSLIIFHGCLMQITRCARQWWSSPRKQVTIWSHQVVIFPLLRIN